MTLGDKQRRFTYMIGKLIFYAYNNGYCLTFGRAYVTQKANKLMGGMDNSLHISRLAVDFNLFTYDKEKNKWIYETSTEAHKPLGIYWESMGGTWGGRFNDGNHYSLEHEGRK